LKLNFCAILIAFLLAGCGKTAYQNSTQSAEPAKVKIANGYSANPESLNLGGYLSISCYSPEDRICIDAIVEVEVMQKPKNFCKSLSKKMQYIGRGCERFAQGQVQNKEVDYSRMGTCFTQGLRIYFFEIQSREDELCAHFTQKLRLPFDWFQDGDSSLLSEALPVEAKKHSLSAKGENFGRLLGESIESAKNCCQSL
jgi:hypothetical protein